MQNESSTTCYVPPWLVLMGYTNGCPGPGRTNEEKQKGLAVLSQVKASKF
jgi:hypothetical protein